MRDPRQQASELAGYEASALVPMSYAEKSMASLMQLHSELMEEKERRVDLYRRLMDKEQALAELKMYVGLLEDQIKKHNEERTSANPAASRPGPTRNVNGLGYPTKPPQPPRPTGRERPRAAMKPRSASDPTASFRPSNGSPRASPTTGSSASPPESAGTDRAGADGWRAW